MSEMKLPDEWQIVKLSQVSDIVMGQSPPSATYNEDGIGLPFLQGKAEFTERYPQPKKYCTNPLKIGKSGSVLISVRAPVGDVNLADQDYIIGRGLGSISLKQGNNEFLFYLLTHYKNKIEAQSSGTTFQSINKTTLQDFSTPLPSLSEQRVIAHTLRTVQQAREARQDEITLERERKAALMQYLFTYGTRGEPRKQTEIGEMPESWRVVKLGEVITLQRGFDLPEKERRPGMIPVVSSSGIFSTHSVAKVSGPGVVTGRYGTIGKIFYIEPDFWPLNTTLFVKDFQGNNPLFISYFLQTVNLSSLNDKTSVPGINRNHAHNILVGLPPLSEQHSIAEVLSACDAKIVALEQEAALLEELFRALLEELMTGRIRVKEAN